MADQNGKNPAEMTPEEFISQGGGKTGLTAWLRSLPMNTPTEMPEAVYPRAGSRGGTRSSIHVAISSVHGSAKAGRITGKFSVRHINGTPWVLRVPDEEVGGGGQ